MRVPCSNQQSTIIIRTTRHLVGFSIQNMSATVDIYFSDDQRQLDNVVAATGVPNAGHRLAGGAGNQGVVIFPWPFQGKLFARAAGIGLQNPPVELEVIPFYGEEPSLENDKGPYALKLPLPVVPLNS